MGLFRKKGASYDGKPLARWVRTMTQVSGGPEAKRIEGVISKHLAKQDPVAVATQLQDVIGDSVYPNKARRRAAYVLGQTISFGHVDAKQAALIMPEITGAMKDAEEDEELMEGLLYLLAQIGPESTSAMPSLVATIKAFENPKIKGMVCGIFGSIGSSAKAAVPLIKQVLETSESWEARSHAAEALGQIGPAAKSAVELLKHASTEDESGDVRMNASEALQLLR